MTGDLISNLSETAPSSPENSGCYCIFRFILDSGEDFSKKTGCWLF